MFQSFYRRWEWVIIYKVSYLSVLKKRPVKCFFLMNCLFIRELYYFQHYRWKKTIVHYKLLHNMYQWLNPLNFLGFLTLGVVIVRFDIFCWELSFSFLFNIIINWYMLSFTAKCYKFDSVLVWTLFVNKSEPITWLFSLKKNAETLCENYFNKTKENQS